MGYASVDEIFEDMTKVYAKMNENPEAKEILENIGELRLHINYTDLDEWVTQEVAGGKVCIQKGQIGEAPVREQIDTDSFVQIMSGEVDPPVLAMAGKVNFEGDFARVLVLQPLLEHTIKAFREVQEEKASG